MCVCSLFGQIVFGALMLVALGLTLVPMFTPGWQQLKDSNGKDIHLGIFFCRSPENNNSAVLLNHNSSQKGVLDSSDGDYCKQWWDNQTPKMKAVIACMCLAVIVEVAAVVWTLITICACCCKSCLAYLLPAFAFVASILLAIAVGIYGTSHKDMIGTIHEFHNEKAGSISYSFYLTCAALVACILDVIVGVVIVMLAGVCL
uniref:Zgc: n=1 Tax=Steinernema glaseri TaxID=37863 RepID=A0A1I8AC94_9BILA